MRSPRIHAAQPGPSSFGDLLRAWRTARRTSQLDLAVHTQVSQRHLSFLESGRATPSRGMVMRLGEVLCVPLRERNRLLMAAGYAPMYPERDLDDADMAAIRQALDTSLSHHEPYPALVVDREWNVLRHNAGVDRLLALLGPASRVWQEVDPSGRRNLMRLSLHPRGLQPLLVDWPQTAGMLLARLQAELQANPAHAGLRDLLAELRALPGVPAVADVHALPTTQVPVLSLRLRQGRTTLALFSMVCTFGAALDLTADELRLELLFPSDESTARFLRASPADSVAPEAQPAARRRKRPGSL